MGIDIYLKWKGQTKAEEKAQFTGFRVDAGAVGYLREGYHGGPYVTKFLVQEAFDAEECEAAIPAAVMRERLPTAILLAIYRDHVVYGEGNDPSVIEIDEASGGIENLARAMATALADANNKKQEAPALTDEQRSAAVRLIDKRMLPGFVLAFVDFVRLAEQKEAERGEPCLVHASY